MSLIVDKKVKIVLTARIDYKENYLKPNSDPGTLQAAVFKSDRKRKRTVRVGIFKCFIIKITIVSTKLETFACRD